MPRITNVHISQKTNLGNYESFEFAADAVISEDENLETATQSVVDYVDWHARKTIRDQKCRTYRRLLLDENTPADMKAEAEAWMAKYNERKERVEAL